MAKLELMPHQKEALEKLKNYDSCAIGYDLGLGKTFLGSEQLKHYDNITNLVVVQCSKVKDWIDHFEKYYSDDYQIYNLTKVNDYVKFIGSKEKRIGVINYDIVFRRGELLDLRDMTLMLDESSMIQHPNTKRTSFIMRLHTKNVILLSGTFTNGKLENLYTQAFLTGYKISKTTFEKLYTVKELQQVKRFNPNTYKLETKYFNQIVGYQNEDKLFRKLHDLGWIFKKTEEVLNLPDKVFITKEIPLSNDYKKFKKNRVLLEPQLIGDTPTKRFIYYRQIASVYSKDKLQALEDILNSTNERVIVFYNFVGECEELTKLCKKLNKPISYMNGSEKDMSAYGSENDSVTLIQYQSGSFGLNLQKCNQTVYYSPPLSCEQFEQSKARTRRIGQDKACFYYKLIMKDSIEKHIYEVLEQRLNFTEKMFKEKYDEEI